MKKLLVVLLVLVCGIYMLIAGGNAIASKCVGVKPICSPGNVPICICESPYSYNCVWICVAKG